MTELEESFEIMCWIRDGVIISKLDIISKYGIDAKTIERAVTDKDLHKPRQFARNEYFNTEHVELWIESMDTEKS